MIIARHSRSAFAILVLIMLLAAPSRAQDVPVVAVTAEVRQAWTGQRIDIQVELRARASFGGATSFYLPDVPKTLILQVGNPVVSSTTIDGEMWAARIHQLAIFSQVDGKLVIPEFAVRFGARDTYTGPLETIEATVPAQEFQIQRPPGSEELAFVVTTESLTIEESWAPEIFASGPMKTGTVIKRTVAQTASGLTGMALAPMPTTAPEGVRVYAGNPEVNDATERGSFIGERKETLAYKLEQPGTVTLPAIQFVWWNPEVERLLSTTLPAVTIDAQAPLAATETPPPATSDLRWAWLLLPAVGAVLVLWQRTTIVRAALRLSRSLHPPERVARRRLLRACRHDEASAAHHAWTEWSSTLHLTEDARLPEHLRRAIDDLERHVFGRQAGGAWDGKPLRRAVRHYAKKTHEREHRPGTGGLPPLNASIPGR